MAQEHHEGTLHIVVLGASGAGKTVFLASLLYYFMNHKSDVFQEVEGIDTYHEYRRSLFGMSNNQEYQHNPEHIEVGKVHRLKFIYKDIPIHLVDINGIEYEEIFGDKHNPKSDNNSEIFEYFSPQYNVFFIFVTNKMHIEDDRFRRLIRVTNSLNNATISKNKRFLVISSPISPIIDNHLEGMRGHLHEEERPHVHFFGLNMQTKSDENKKQAVKLGEWFDKKVLVKYKKPTKSQNLEGKKNGGTPPTKKSFLNRLLTGFKDLLNLLSS